MIKSARRPARPSQLKLFTSTLFSVGFEIESFIRSSNNTFFFRSFHYMHLTTFIATGHVAAVIVILCEPFYEFSASIYSLFYVVVSVCVFARLTRGGFMYFYVILSQ